MTGFRAVLIWGVVFAFSAVAPVWGQVAEKVPSKNSKKTPLQGSKGPGKSGVGLPAKKVRTQSKNIDAEPSLYKEIKLRGVVSKISVTNNKKIESDAVLAKLKTKTGEPVNADSLRADVQNIFNMGYFFNVEVIQDVASNGDVELTYKVTEKPSIVDVVFRGNDRVDKDDLQEAAGLKQYTILDYSKLREAVDKLTKLYEDKGYFLARVQSKVEDVKPGEEVRVVFDIKENDKVQVKKITFLGNRALSDTKLKSVMETQEGGFFSSLSSSGSYKQEIFDRDIQVLNFFYFNQGYVRVRIDRPQVYVTPDKKGIFITIRIEEGEQFNVGKVDFAGDLLFTKDELFEKTEIQKSGTFIRDIVQKDLEALRFLYGDLGYAFANIIPRLEIRDKERLVDLTYEIEKGQKVYFGKIIITGNTKTRDKVVRRELRIKEGELYNETRKRKSEENVKRLGYFSEVIFNTSSPPDDPTILNIDIQVKERSTGTISVGAGYSSIGVFLFNGQINQTNLFGRGQTLGLAVNISNVSSTYNLGFTEPYFKDTEWSVGFDVYRTDRRLVTYQEVRTGGDIRFGHPIAEYVYGYLTYKLDDTQIALDKYTDRVLYNPDSVKGIASALIGSVVYDRRNDRWAPSNGEYASISLEHAGFGGVRRYTKGFLNGRLYREIFWKLVLRNNLTYGFLGAPDGREPPFNELFLLGGANSLRGYRWFTVGKKRFTTCCQRASATDDTPVALSKPLAVPYGGTQQLFYNAELEFMLVAEAQIKGVLFYDVGMADDVIQLGLMRQDVGFGFRWFSPIGPLRFEWGFPIDRRPELGEDFSNFEFSIGSPF